jgi:hypothetical protein
LPSPVEETMQQPERALSLHLSVHLLVLHLVSLALLINLVSLTHYLTVELFLPILGLLLILLLTDFRHISL